jgi:DNA-directed RNA polymerase specialized sigma24 family protein
MDTLVLRVASELAPAEISDRLDRDEIEVQEILAGAFEKLRRLPVKETT